MNARLSLGESATASAAFALVLFAYLLFAVGPVSLEADALRYADYVVNLNQYGVFGLSFGAVDTPAEPGRANAPLYQFLVAALAWFDMGLRETLVCAVTGGTDCSLNLKVLYALNAVLGGVAALLGFVLAWRFTASRAVAWGTGALVVLGIIMLRNGHALAPANAVLPAFFALSLALDRFWQTGSWRAVLWAGLLVGVTTLIRPSYHYLLYGLVLGFAVHGVLHREWRPTAALVVGFVLAIAPWALRNWFVFGDFALSGGQYGEIIIAQRFAYNAMTWGQWAVSFLYWLPEFGDQAAAVLFSEELYAPLGLGPGTYFETAIADVYEASLARVGEGGVMGDLIARHVFGEPVKYMAVTASLAWRGLFVAKTFGLIGLICTLLALPTGGWRFALLLAPMAFMVAFHAAISISIERYNLFLILPYALATAWVVHTAVERLRAK